MLKDFKTEWNAIWKISDGLQTGVEIKDSKTTIPDQIRLLKAEVTTYQQLVDACGSVKKGDDPIALLAKIEESFIAVQTIEEVLLTLIDLQIDANKTAPKGALMRPSSYPSTLYNPTLEKLGTELSSVVAAMQADLLAAGLNTEVETAQENMAGVSIKPKVTEAKFTAPSWFKTK
ncbi:MAG: hypothetical protein JJ871_06595 [Thalassospira sp.]|uniref:hypothetical protein n=1 Tax=Thalassospira sp. TaxID=1912094 RepID=UPI001B2B92A5|nr:hypothetical protein [Thalassospira sp.]MBO6579114.1 hypothetical protein [Thalassospira sp.]MBO6802457.1 hypothetical protein [Thalassospira sp.]MBO6818785.1 hypothetical protein [Thalassospira sp.]MBO6887719.1 hypothetical protein [Thalassospira sp.]